MTALRHFLLALQFFTRIPVTGRLAVWVGFSPAMLRASAAYFPAVGVVIGCLVVALSATLMYYLPTAYAPLVAAALGTAWSVWLTGAFHEDGLASALIFVYLLRLFERRLQGFTGDCLGTTQQLCEIAFYFGCAMALGGGF